MEETRTTTNLKMLLGSAGALGGLYYAFTKKKGGWGYVGFFVLGAIAGHLAGNIIGGVISPATDNDSKLMTSTTSTTTNTTTQDDKTPTTKPPLIKGTATQM